MANLDVDNVRFTPVRLRTGYDMGEVDAHLDRVKAHLAALDAAVAGTGQAPEPLRHAAFSEVRLREGYDIGEVDAFLDQVDAEDARLRGLAHSGIAAVGQAASPTTDPVVDPSAPDVVVDVSAPATPPAPAVPIPEPLIGNLTTQPLIREVGSRSTNLVLVVLVLAAAIAMLLVILLSK